MQAGMSCEEWFPLTQRRDRARLRLVCFPFAGGSASAFTMWTDELPEWVELRALQLPGRASRLREQPVSHLADLLPLLRRAIDSLTDLPMVFFGHSNGALIAYELARVLSRESKADVRYIVLSGKAAPRCDDDRPWRHQLSDSELIAELQQFGGTPPELLAHREFMTFMLPAIRADFALSETHRFAAEALLDVPAALWWGRDDSSVAPEKVRQWQRYLPRPARVREFPGGHFYLQDNREEVVRGLLEILYACGRFDHMLRRG